MARTTPDDVTPDVTPIGRSREVLIAFSIHGLTALGVVLGLFGLVAVLDGDAKAALLWLVAAQVLDGIDGPLARAYDVKQHAPHVDGYVLDLVVDFVTTVVVPVAFLYRFDLVPEGWAMVTSGIILFTAALWFARTDLMTEDHWFNGFPATWNLVVAPLYLFGTAGWINLVVIFAFCVLTLSNFKFVHPMQVDIDRPVTMAITVLWLGTLTILTFTYPSVPVLGEAIVIAGAVYFFWIGAIRTWRNTEPEAAVVGV